MRAEFLDEPNPLHPQSWIGVEPQEQVLAVHEAGCLRSDVEKLIEIDLPASPSASQHAPLAPLNLKKRRPSHRLVAARHPPLRAFLQPLHGLLGVARLHQHKDVKAEQRGALHPPQT